MIKRKSKTRRKPRKPVKPPKISPLLQVYVRLEALEKSVEKMEHAVYELVSQINYNTTGLRVLARDLQEDRDAQKKVKRKRRR